MRWLFSVQLTRVRPTGQFRLIEAPIRPDRTGQTCARICSRRRVNQTGRPRARAARDDRDAQSQSSSARAAQRRTAQIGDPIFGDHHARVAARHRNGPDSVVTMRLCAPAVEGNATIGTPPRLLRRPQKIADAADRADIRAGDNFRVDRPDRSTSTAELIATKRSIRRSTCGLCVYSVPRNSSAGLRWAKQRTRADPMMTPPTVMPASIVLRAFVTTPASLRGDAVADAAGMHAEVALVVKRSHHRVRNRADARLQRRAVFDERRDVLPDRLLHRPGHRRSGVRERRVRPDQQIDVGIAQERTAVGPRHVGMYFRDDRPRMFQRFHQIFTRKPEAVAAVLVRRRDL